MDDDDVMMAPIMTQEDAWAVVTSYFEEKGLVRQQLDSFDSFINTSLTELVEDTPRIRVRTNIQYMPGKQATNASRPAYMVKFGKVFVGQPVVIEADQSTSVLLPHEARLRNLTYRAPVYVGVNCGSEGDFDPDAEDLPQEFIGYVPIMLRSGYCRLKGKSDQGVTELNECIYDQGGYFIINGSEKVIVAQERMINNAVLCFEKKPPHKASWVSEIRSQVAARPTSTIYVNLHRWSGSKTGSVGGVDGGQIRIQMPYIRDPVPVVVLFRALGCVTDRDILQRICYQFDDVEMMEAFRPSIEESMIIANRQIALDFIGRRGSASNVLRAERIQYARDLLKKELLPHIGTGDHTENKKAYFLGYIINKLLLCSLGRRREDDRDHYANKRLDLAGPLMGDLFRILFKRLVKDMQSRLQRCADQGQDFNLSAAVKNRIITDGLQYSLATGNWGLQKGAAAPKAGVSQVLNRLTYAATLAHLRCLNTPLAREGKMAKPRQLHNTHWGYMCPAETPEGQACGLVKNLALMCYVSVGTPQAFVLELLEEFGTQSLEVVSPADIPNSTKVFVNGNWVGVHGNAQHLVSKLLLMRRQVMSSLYEVSIMRDIREREVRICTEAGRCCRPLFIVDNSSEGSGASARCTARFKHDHSVKLQSGEMKWTDLIRQGLIEYVDTAEEETVMIAMEPDDLKEQTTYTHLEIHPSVVLGICASIIPFPDHNQSPRNTYQSAMGKQAMGIYCSNFALRMDTLAHILFYPQKPLVTTRAMKHMHFRELPAGVNATVAIACYSGYNQEDSLIMNQGSIDRGFFRSVFFRTYMDQENEDKKNRLLEEFRIPMTDSTSGLKSGDYSKLDVDGLVECGVRVAGSDVIIGKVTPQMALANGLQRHMHRDSSTSMRSNESGLIEKVMLTSSKDGFKFCKVKVRSVRIPQIGDKFASRHGQKGTVGMTYGQEDMPFTCEGIVPDIIVNPHAIPSRMTIGHLIECLLGKVSTLTGDEGDATPFMELEVSQVMNTLHKMGYEKRGNEVMYNGRTGRKLAHQIYLGPTYYQRLKHMVDDKIHSRARGPTTMLTRQPMEGRAREGGLRFGEMERDCLISHGAAHFLRDRLFVNSDKYRVHVCDLCGLIAKVDFEKMSFKCRSPECNNNTTRISQVDIPYACKLLFQELMAMSIAPRMFVHGREGKK